MEKVVNFEIPELGEQIFESIDTPGLINCLKVSQTWKVWAENVLIKRWKGKMLEACKNGETKVVQLLLELCTSEESGLDTKDEFGNTPFMVACGYGHKEIVQILLDNSERIDLNANGNLKRWSSLKGLTVLIIGFKWAVYYGREDVIRLLKEHPKTRQSLVEYL